MEEEKFEWEYDEYDAGCYDIKEEDEEEGLDWNEVEYNEYSDNVLRTQHLR